MDCSVFAWFRSLRNKGQRRGLERAKGPFQLATREWADVTAHGKLFLDDAIIYIMKRTNGGVIGRGICILDKGNAKVKTLGEALDEVGVSFLQTKA